MQRQGHAHGNDGGGPVQRLEPRGVLLPHALLKKRQSSAKKKTGLNSPQFATIRLILSRDLRTWEWTEKSMAELRCWSTSRCLVSSSVSLLRFFTSNSSFCTTASNSFARRSPVRTNVRPSE